MPASRHSAARVSRRRRRGGAGSARSALQLGLARRAAPRRRRLGERVRDGAAGEHEALAERVRREPVGAVQAGARGLADGVQPGQRRVRVQVGDDAAHRVVGGRRDRDQLARRVEAGLAQRADDVGEVRGVDAAHVEPDRALAGLGAGAPGSRARPRRAARARRRSARRRVVQRRALAADRLGDEEALAPGDADHGRRVELQQLEVGERGAGLRGRAAARRPASRAGWSCAPTARRRRRCRSRRRARR